MSHGTGPDAAPCRARARAWLERSRDLYRALDASGALAGEDRRAPAEVDRMLAQLAVKRS
jgi:hypothetical protein